MHFSRTLVPAVAFASGLHAVQEVVADPGLTTIQSRPDNHALNQDRADAVKASFQFAWDGYKKYAFPNDELRPVTNGFTNSRQTRPSRIDKLGKTDNGLGTGGVRALWMPSVRLW